jgi:hypothetical protein
VCQQNVEVRDKIIKRILLQMRLTLAITLCHDLRVCATIYVYVPRFTCMCHDLCVCATIYVYVPRFTCMCHDLCVCATIYVYVPRFMCMCHDLCVCATIYVYVHLRIKPLQFYYSAKNGWNSKCSPSAMDEVLLQNFTFSQPAIKLWL